MERGLGVTLLQFASVQHVFQTSLATLLRKNRQRLPTFLR
jgi:hypothetical protein